MADLLKKEKDLHKEIRKDFKKISMKVNADFDKGNQNLRNNLSCPFNDMIPEFGLYRL